MIGIGIDTGGTYTDVVVYDMDNREVLCSGKTPTTRDDLEKCILKALDSMDKTYVKQAELLAISTTLATNACLENKGGRAKGLMIGMEPKSTLNLEQVYARYGLRDIEQLVFIDGRPENIYVNPIEPDWDDLAAKAADMFRGCKAVGITQIYPRANGGRFERIAKQILSEKLDVPITTAFEMSDDVDPLRRGAGTLLNARLIPLIDDFMKAVRLALSERGLDIPIAVVCSDGSLLTEEMAKEQPVGTLLSGPAASVIGGSVIAGEPDALIVDMGGTTTDIALIRDGRPILAKDGISIGPWKTTVKGLYVNTSLLGGDSAVRFSEGEIVLEGDRVIPLSVLSSTYPYVTDRLKELADEGRHHTRMLSEFMVLQNDIGDNPNYTAAERHICDILRGHPLILEDLAEQLDTSIYKLNTERLEEEGVLMRSGLTPTDMMTICGDLDFYRPDAAKQALRFLSKNTGVSETEIPATVYRLVEKKMYCQIAEILLLQKYPKKWRLLGEDGVRLLIEQSFEEAYAEALTRKKPEWIRLALTTDLPIIGVGAPIHIFLPRVAQLLGTRAILHQYSSVANALGAIASQVVTRVTIRVHADYVGSMPDGYSVMDGENRIKFEHYPDAEKYASDLALRLVREKARRNGNSETPHIEIKAEKIYGVGVYFETVVEAIATDEFKV